MRVGIDLGTTNSAIAYINNDGQPEIVPNREGERTTPSVILYEDDTFIVGDVAKEGSVDNPSNTVQFVKRQIGNKVYKREFGNEEYTSEKLSAIILKRLKEDAEKFLGEPVTEAVITVPAYFDDSQRKATKDAGEIAGFNVLKMINEPTAAALAYTGDEEKETQNIMVYDLGGGTFDVTIMSYSKKEVIVKATDGNRNLGGFDFDNEIIKYISGMFEDEFGEDLEDDEEAFQDLREKAENVKKQLSSRNKANISIQSKGNKFKETITAVQFEEWTKHLINRTYLIMEEAVEEAGLKFSDLDKILLVGGSIRMPIVQKMIIEKTGIVPSNEVHPNEVVALGAAIQASMMDMDINSRGKNVIDVNSHGLGIISQNIQGESENSVILIKNTPIPATAKDQFQTIVDNQEFLNVQVTEGDTKDIEDIKIIGNSIIRLNQRPAGSPITIVLSYDENAIINVEAIETETNIKLDDITIERKSNLEQIEIDKMKNHLSKIIVD